MKIIRIKNNVTIILDDGSVMTSSSCTDTMYESLKENEGDDDAIRTIMIPEFFKKKEIAETKKDLIENLETSNYLIVEGASVYLKGVSELSLPEDLATAILMAEKRGDIELVDSYINFWTLASLNPDSRARTNLFWFLNKYGMTISKSGLFIAYRNVEIKDEGSDLNLLRSVQISKFYVKVKMKWKKSPKKHILIKDRNTKEYGTIKEDQLHIVDSEDTKVVGNLQELYDSLNDDTKSTTYTDSYTGKFTIKIGEPVTMPRSECDSKQENTCSRGLHVAGREWLQDNYFGKQSLIVLVNPADVVAVPPKDSYGKMRTCAYYPVALVERDQQGEIINGNFDDGFEDDFMNMISYQGDINNKETITYTLEIPNIPELNKDKIYNRLNHIKKELSKKVIN